MRFSFDFLQDWSWLTTGGFVIYGPLSKNFAYAVWFQCTDEYGNVYNGDCSTRLIRHVGVSTEKQLLAAAAFSAAATAERGPYATYNKARALQAFPQ